jgi:hypothetical protein
MKKIILGLSAIALLVSCSKSPEEQAKENIEKFITSKMDDPKSYESVSFGKLEKTKSSVNDDDKYFELVKEELHIDSLATISYNDAMNFTSDKAIASATKNYEEINKLLQSQIQEVKEYKKKYNPVDIYKIKHSYRGKNKMGALILDSCTVILDKDLKVKFIQ